MNKEKNKMKRLVAIITAIALFAAGINFTPKKVEASVTSSQGSSSWSLVWSDEFNQTSGSTVNSNYWSMPIWMSPKKAFRYILPCISLWAVWL